jgi:hypothetical protein
VGSDPDGSESMVMHKKGMFFTILTILFLVVFLFFFTQYSYRKLTDKMFVVESRITSMDSFLQDVDRDLERGLYISSFRAIISLQDYMGVQGAYLSNVKNDFNEVITVGTINGTVASLMDHAKISDWIQNIISQANRLNLRLNISIINFTVYQKDPWHLHVGVNVTLHLNDTTNIAQWVRNDYIETSLDITGFEDPLYIINGRSRFGNIINRTPYENNFTIFNGSVYNVANLLFHVEHSLYAADQNAPSFLMRFENNLSASPYGIESMINLQKLSTRFTEEEMTIYYDKSIIDYVYWSTASPDIYRINNTPSWYKIDDIHRAVYNVTSISYLYE